MARLITLGLLLVVVVVLVSQTDLMSHFVAYGYRTAAGWGQSLRPPASSPATPEPSVAAPAPALPSGEIPAFPGAEGYGAVSVGGRGGRVIAVTSLNDSGPGSLRAAIEASGPRTVVFRVCGTIALRDTLRIRNPYITIAGQTACGGGIQLSGMQNAEGEMIQVFTHDVVIRYLRVRSGMNGTSGQGQVNISVREGAYNVIVDHVSVAWSLDENMSISRQIPDGENPNTWPEIRNVTIQRSLIGEGLYPHSTGVALGGENAYGPTMSGGDRVFDVSIHRNLFASNSHRNPGLGIYNAQVINNVIYNWSTKASETHRSARVDWIGNYWKPGRLSSDASANLAVSKSVIVHNAFDASTPTRLYPPPSLYMSGNVLRPNLPRQSGPLGDQFELYRVHYSDVPLPESYRRSAPLPAGPIPVTVEAADAAYASVMADVGATRRLACDGSFVSNTDDADRRILNDVEKGTGPGSIPAGQWNDYTHLANPATVGGFPTIAQETPCADADRDGMPDQWETARGLNPAIDDSAEKTLSTVWTNLEMYLQ